MTYSLNISRELKNELNQHPELIKKLMLLANGENSFTANDTELFKSIASNNIKVVESKPTSKRRSKEEILSSNIEDTYAKLNRAKDMLEKNLSDLDKLKEGSLGREGALIRVDKYKAEIQKHNNTLASLNVKMAEMSKEA